MITGKMKSYILDGVIITYIEDKKGVRHVAKLNLGNLIEFELGTITPQPLSDEIEVSNETTVGELRSKILDGLQNAENEEKRDSWQNVYDSLKEYTDETPLSEVLETLTKRGYAK